MFFALYIQKLITTNMLSPIISCLVQNVTVLQISLLKNWIWWNQSCYIEYAESCFQADTILQVWFYFTFSQIGWRVGLGEWLVVVVLSLSGFVSLFIHLSIHSFVSPYKLDCLHNYWGTIFRIFFQTWLEYVNILRQFNLGYHSSLDVCIIDQKVILPLFAFLKSFGLEPWH